MPASVFYQSFGAVGRAVVVLGKSPVIISSWFATLVLRDPRSVRSIEVGWGFHTWGGSCRVAVSSQRLWRRPWRCEHLCRRSSWSGWRPAEPPSRSLSEYSPVLPHCPWVSLGLGLFGYGPRARRALSPLNSSRRCRSGAKSSEDCGSSRSVATRPTLSPVLVTKTS